jgi:hypothetical protein
MRHRAVAGVVLSLTLTLVGGCGLRGSSEPPRENGPGASLDKQRHRVVGTELFRGDWETGNLRQWDGFQRVATDRIRVVTDPVDQGRYAGRFEVRNGDNPIGFGDRAEVQLGTGEHEGQERWYAWSTMFDHTYPISDAWQVVTQWHAEDLNGTPPVAFYVIRDQIVLQTNPHDGAGNPIRREVVRWSAPLDRGTWHHFRFHVVWSGSDTRGLIELWHDGVKVAGPIRTRTLYPGHDAYFKQGLYRQSGEPRTGIVYHDAFRMSAVGPAGP